MDLSARGSAPVSAWASDFAYAYIHTCVRTSVREARKVSGRSKEGIWAGADRLVVQHGGVGEGGGPLQDALHMRRGQVHQHALA